MTRAAAALRDLIQDAASGIGIEGAFLAIGTALVAVGASYIAPAGPWLVVGTVSLALGLALAAPRKS